MKINSKWADRSCTTFGINMSNRKLTQGVELRSPSSWPSLLRQDDLTATSRQRTSEVKGLAARLGSPIIEGAHGR